jgi:hypothetical protein
LKTTIKRKHEELTQVRKQLAEARHHIALLQSENEALPVAGPEKEVELIQIKTLDEGHIDEEIIADKQKRMRVKRDCPRANSSSAARGSCISPASRREGDLKGRRVVLALVITRRKGESRDNVSFAGMPAGHVHSISTLRVVSIMVGLFKGEYVDLALSQRIFAGKVRKKPTATVSFLYLCPETVAAATNDRER